MLEILDGRKSPLTHDSGFDSGLGSQSLSASRSEGKAVRSFLFILGNNLIYTSVCLSVGRSVGQSIAWLDGWSTTN